MKSFLTVTEQFTGWLWHLSWQVSVLIVLVLLLQWLFRRWLSPSWRYCLWLLVVVRLVVPISPESTFSIFNLAQSKPLAVWKSLIANEPRANNRPPTIEPTRAAGPDFLEGTTLLQEPEPVEMGLNLSPSELPLVASDSSKQPSLSLWIFFLWAIGAALLLSRVWYGARMLGLGMRQARRIDDAATLGVLEDCRRCLGLNGCRFCRSAS